MPESRMKKKLPSILAALAFLLCLIPSAALWAYPVRAHVFWITAVVLLGLILGAVKPTVFIAGFFFSMPLVGGLQLVYNTPPTSLILPYFFAGLAGKYLMAWTRKQDNPTFNLPLDIGVLALYLVFNLALTLYHYRPFTDMNRIVSDAPWGQTPLKNALGWVWLGFLTPVSGVCLYGWFNSSDKPRNMINLSIRSLLAGFSLCALIGLLQFRGWDSLYHATQFFQGGIRQFNAGFNHPNSLGISAALSLIIWLGYLLENKKKALVYLAGPALLFLVLISSSRSAFLITVLSFLFLLTLSLRRKIFLLLLIYLSLIVFGMFVHQHQVTQYPESNRVAPFLIKVITIIKEWKPLVGVIGDRDSLWQAGLKVFQLNPVLGTGVGNYLIKLSTLKFVLPRITNDNCANNYLQIAAEWGLIGLTLFLIVIIRTMGSFLKSGLERHGPLKNSAFAALLGLCIGFIVGAHLQVQEINFLFWFLIFIARENQPSIQC